MKITNALIGYHGRLGNQLFQFSCLYGMAKKTGNTPVLPLSNLEGVDQVFYGSKLTKTKLDLIDIFPKTKNFVERVELYKEGYRDCREGCFCFDPAIERFCSSGSNINLIGYFQSPLYFDEYRDDLLDILSFNKNFTQPERNTPLVSLHVRRTDYLNLTNNYKQLALENYYNKAIEKFDGCNFFVFSDDIEWCKENFIGDRFVFSEHDTEGMDLQKMSLCDHHIISNSTFAWWGAYLNKSKDKKIIAPKNWFRGDYAHYNNNELNLITQDQI